MSSAKCYPTYGSLNTGDWDLVLNLNIEGGINMGSLLLTNSTTNGNSTTGNSTSSSSSSSSSNNHHNNDDDDNGGGYNVTRAVIARLVESNNGATHLEVMGCVLLLIWTLIFL